MFARTCAFNSLPWCACERLPVLHAYALQANNQRKEAWRAADELADEYKRAESEHARASEVGAFDVSDLWGRSRLLAAWRGSAWQLWGQLLTWQTWSGCRGSVPRRITK